MNTAVAHLNRLDVTPGLFTNIVRVCEPKVCSIEGVAESVLLHVFHLDITQRPQRTATCSMG